LRDEPTNNNEPHRANSLHWPIHLVCEVSPRRLLHYDFYLAHYFLPHLPMGTHNESEETCIAAFQKTVFLSAKLVKCGSKLGHISPSTPTLSPPSHPQSQSQDPKNPCSIYQWVPWYQHRCFVGTHQVEKARWKGLVKPGKSSTTGSLLATSAT